jgi:putative endonuclease
MFFRRKLNRTQTDETGRWGEDVAARMLAGKGYKILGTRVLVGKHDELDLVARLGEILVFVEVKTRKTEGFGRPLSSVDRRKQRAMSRAAVRYIGHLKNPRVNFRFDVVEVVGEVNGRAPVVRHVENAFALSRWLSLPG